MFWLPTTQFGQTVTNASTGRAASSHEVMPVEGEVVNGDQMPAPGENETSEAQTARAPQRPATPSEAERNEHGRGA